jgi:CHASE3 domain sensor protein
MSWLTKKPDFLEQYTRAREIQAETQFDELIDIVDQPPELSHITDKNGELVEVKFDSSYVAWMKLRVDTRKWTAARMAPKKYGENKQAQEQTDPTVIDVSVKSMLDVAVKRLELIRIAE